MSWQPYNPNHRPPAGGPQRQWAPPQQSAPPPPTAYRTPPQGHQSPGTPPQGYGYQQPPGPSGYRDAPPRYSNTPPSSYGGVPPSSHSNAPPPSNYGGGPPAGYGGGPPSGYGGGAPTSNGRTGTPQGPPGLPPGMDPDVFFWFQTVDRDKSGKITACELRDALLNNNWSHFNSETCRLLIGMFDSNGDGAIDIQEFVALWKYVQEWKSCFDTFDKDKSGNIDSLELQQALQSFGYRLSTEFCDLCTRVFDRSDKRTMKFDDFIQCCVMLKSLTEGFRKMDTDRTGIVTISYEQFLEMAVDNTM